MSEPRRSFRFWALNQDDLEAGAEEKPYGVKDPPDTHVKWGQARPALLTLQKDLWTHRFMQIYEDAKGWDGENSPRAVVSLATLVVVLGVITLTADTLAEFDWHCVSYLTWAIQAVALEHLSRHIFHPEHVTDEIMLRVAAEQPDTKDAENRGRLRRVAMMKIVFLRKMFNHCVKLASMIVIVTRSDAVDVFSKLAGLAVVQGIYKAAYTSAEQDLQKHLVCPPGAGCGKMAVMCPKMKHGFGFEVTLKTKLGEVRLGQMGKMGAHFSSSWDFCVYFTGAATPLLSLAGYCLWIMRCPALHKHFFAPHIKPHLLELGRHLAAIHVS